MHNATSGTSHYHAVTATKGLVVVDFSAGWCGPCRMIGPHFDAMAAQYPDITFAKVRQCAFILTCALVLTSCLSILKEGMKEP